MWAKQSTAATLIVGPILDSAGAEYTSAVIGDLSISKNGGTLTALAAAATLTHIANGQYTLVMTTGNLDTLGRLQITCNKSTYQMPPIGLNIVPADRYDSLVLGTDLFDANVTHVADTSQTAGDIYASQVAIAGYIDTEVSAIKAKTDNLPSDPADQSAVQAAITAATSPLATQASVDAIQADTNDIQTRLPAALDGGRIAAVLDSASRATLVDEIWDEVLTGATHNVASSAGRRIRQINAFQQVDGSVNDLAASTLSFVTDLASSVNDFYNDSMLVFTTGALAGQVRAIVDYVGSTKTITVEEALTSAPANGSEFTIVSLHIHPVSQIQSGLATAASITTLRGADNDTLKTLSDQIDGIGGGGGGSGDASQATLLEVKAKTDLIGSAAGVTALLAASVLEPGAITSFPETLRIGDSYTDVLGRAIQLPVVDTDGSPLTSAGSKDFADATATFVIKRANDTEDSRIITGTAVFVDPPGTGTSEAPYALIEIPSSETAKGLVKYRYTGLLTFTWPYVGTGTDAEVMTFETGTIVFES